MKKLLIVLLISSLPLLFNGCLTCNVVSYEVMKPVDGKGTVIVEIFDIRTDSETEEEINEDINYLFDYSIKSNEFVVNMNDEGKEVISRELIKKEDELDGRVLYSYTDIKNVEGLVYDDSYYYLTLSPDDSIVSTNGEIIIQKDYKRIVWDDSHKTLKFQMFAVDTRAGGYKSMLEFYKD